MVASVDKDSVVLIPQEFYDAFMKPGDEACD